MAENETQAEIQRLREEIREHDKRYYVDATSTISDFEYDRLMEQLRALEAAHPTLVTPDSPTQRVAGEPIEGFQTVEHARPMYSIDNTYDAESLRRWAQRCFEALDPQIGEIDAAIVAVEGQIQSLKGQRDQRTSQVRKELQKKSKALKARRKDALAEGDRAGFPIEGGYYAEPKIDGAALSLRYENGKLELAVTRGNGERGDNVTQNVLAVDDIPKSLKSIELLPAPDVLEVRGELFMPFAEFRRINEAFVMNGKEPFANPRNATAGTLKQLDPRIVAERRLEFIAHGRGEVIGLDSVAHSEFLGALSNWGIHTNKLSRICRSIDDAWAVIEDFDSRRADLSYGVDGVVVKVDLYDEQDALGFTSRFPRWCIAYKYAAEQAETTLLRVDWQVGKTGKLTPRAIMEPVLVAGTTVQHATLHNLGEIRKKDLRIGDRVVIEKAGEIIPQVVRVASKGRRAGSEPVSAPTSCPECGGGIEIEHDKDGKETGRFCINAECPAQFRERLVHFVGRAHMDIDGLGEEIIDQLLAKQLLAHIADIYGLTEKDLADLEHEGTSRGKKTKVRLGEKTAAHIRRSIDESKSRGLARVLAALGIHHIGIQTAKLVASRFKDIDEMTSSTEEEIRSSVSDSRDVAKFHRLRSLATAFHEALHSDEGKSLVLEAKNIALADPGQSEVLVFLNALPDGGNRWRVKWGTGGGKKDRLLAHYSSLEKLQDASIDELVKLFDDEVVGQSLYDFLMSEDGKETIRRLRVHEVSFTSVRKRPKEAHPSLTGKHFVVTGTLERFKRDEIRGLIEDMGGLTSDSVTRSTDYLIAGSKGGSKLAKAEELGVKVISEDEFVGMLEEAGGKRSSTLF